MPLWKSLSPDNRADFSAAWALYCRAFPPEERRSLFWQLKAMRREPSYRCMLLQEGGETLALLFYWLHRRFVFVEHLAVAESRRSQGWGGLALASLPSELPLLLEIEPVCDARTARRLAFYARHGFVPLPQPHCQLPFRRGDAPLPLQLLGRPAASAVAGDAFPVEQLELFLEERVMRYRER